MKKLAVKEVELIYRLSQHNKIFQKEIEMYRGVFNIPENGFQSLEEIFTWENFNISNYAYMVVKMKDTAKKFKLSPSTDYLLANYLVNNLRFNLGKETFNTPAYIVKPEEVNLRYTAEEVRLKKENIPHVKVIIYPYATKGAFLDYIDNVWTEEIEPLMKKQTGPTKRIKKTLYKERDTEVRKLGKLSRKELGLKKGEYKYIKIAEMLKGKYKLTSDQVQKILNKKEVF